LEPVQHFVRWTADSSSHTSKPVEFFCFIPTFCFLAAARQAASYISKRASPPLLTTGEQHAIRQMLVEIPTTKNFPRLEKGATKNCREGQRYQAHICPYEVEAGENTRPWYCPNCSRKRNRQSKQ
jgi:hypothetical protein